MPIWTRSFKFYFFLITVAKKRRLGYRTLYSIIFYFCYRHSVDFFLKEIFLIALFSFIMIKSYYSVNPLQSNARFSYSSYDRQLFYSETMNSNNKYYKEILLIYTTCPPEGLDLRLPLWKTKVPAIGIKCNSTTNFFDCNEAGLYLDFIIQHYDRPLAKTYIFAHGHELAWHYPISLLTAINKVIQTRYFKKQNFGGIFDTMYSQGPYSPIEIDWAPRLYKFVFNGTSMPSKMIEKHNCPILYNLIK